MEHHTFKVAYRYGDIPSRVIELYTKKKVSNSFHALLSEGGSVVEVHRELTPEEHKRVVKLSLDKQESLPNDPKRKRCYGVFGYVSLDDEMKMTTIDDQLLNRRNRLSHEFLKFHSDVIVRDANGNNANGNSANGSYELINESQNVINETTTNKRMAEAVSKITDMFENNKESFIDFCYAFGLSNISTRSYQDLYNICMFKIKISPELYFKTIAHAQYPTLLIVRKAQSTKDGEKNVIYIEGNFWYFNQAAIGKSEEEVIDHFVLNAKDRALLESKMNVTPLSKKLEIKEVVEPLQAVDGAGLGKDSRAAYDRQLITDMKTAVYKLKAIKDEGERAARLSKLRETYSGRIDTFDDIANKIMKDFAFGAPKV